MEDLAVVHDGLGHVVSHILGVFYADNGIMVCLDPYWLQEILNFFIRLFRKINLASNAAKSKTMTFQLRKITSGMSNEAFGQRSTGGGAT